MLKNKYQEYYQIIAQRIDAKRIFTDKASTLAYGTDASFYRLIPQMIIQSESVEEVSFLLKEANKLGLSVTFRAAGTSLSGQAITDSILILAGHFWTQHQILDEGKRIRLQPGIIGAQANRLLKPYGRKIGPDPASINAAMIGGIAANNASGMCCGTAQNSYKTLHSLKILFYDGFLLDTADQESIELFKRHHAAIYQGIDELAKATKENEALAQRIRDKFKMKNTTGYSINALVDYDDPIDIIAHLMIGSEGTLGMITEITYNTVEDPPYKACALIIYDSLEHACSAVSALKAAPVAAVELMDRASLRSVENMEGVPNYLPELSPNAAALLVETRSMHKGCMEKKVKEIRKIIDHIPTERPYIFTDDPAKFSKYWKIRKGLFPSVGAMRNIGTSVIIEDVTFPVAQLVNATLDLQALFRKYAYHEAVIFGHALEGNLHFVFTQDFSTEEEVTRYDNFMVELADLVVDKYDGALKAEHGTGRNMAPFVEKEWGEEAYELMCAIKDIFDPRQIINPGVIINDDAKLHLKNLKPLPAVDEIVDTCIECGFCESSCLSHSFTYSPRQRIVLLREASRLKSIGKDEEATRLLKEADYGIDKTCSADGLCSLACPVDINTGAFIKKMRKQKNGDNKWAEKAANNVSSTAKLLRTGLSIGHATSKLFGDNIMDKIASNSTGILGQKTHWSPDMPKAMSTKKLSSLSSKEDALKVVYFTTCINRIMGAAKDADNKESVFYKTMNILAKANCEVIFPENLEDQCCGLAFSSQGFDSSAKVVLQRLKNSLLLASEGGKYPIVFDMSPCLLQAKEGLNDLGLKLYDLTDFTTTFLIDRLEFTPIDEPVAVFSVCSLKKMGIADQLVKIAKLCSTQVYQTETNCCGFAGNKGFTHPELNAFGLRDLDAQIPEGVKYGYATSRTCEIGLSTHSKAKFLSIVNLIDRATQSKRKIKRSPSQKSQIRISK